MKLRKYQQEAVDAVFAAWQTVRRVLIVLPTGCGKTIVFASIIRRLLAEAAEADADARRVLVLAHRAELVMQAKEKIAAIAPNADVQVEMGDFRVSDYFGRCADVVVSTVQTQSAQADGRPRRTRFSPSDFAAVVVDEAHHATAATYRDCLDHYAKNPDCRVLGVTATPDRADEAALGSVFGAVAYEYTVTDAIRDGWLVPVRQQLVRVESLDFSRVKTTGGDLNAAELAEVMEDERNLHGIVAPTVEICRGHRAILFAASVRQAERICEIINRSGDVRAGWVCGATPRDERQERIEAFRRGETQVLCNVGVLTEGFDDAGVDVVVMARPTKSRALYAQMAGRATRPAAEIAARLGEDPDATGEARRAMIAASSKPGCLIVDFVGNSGRHKLVTTVDILAGKDPDDVRERARRRLAEGDAKDTLEALDEARAEMEEERRKKAEEARRADEARRAGLRASARYARIDVDPFDAYDLPPARMRPGDMARRLSLKQEALLRQVLKVDPDALGYARSRQLLDEFFRRQQNGLATLAQTRLLKRLGVDVPLRRDEAKRVISRVLTLVRANAPRLSPVPSAASDGHCKPAAEMVA